MPGRIDGLAQLGEQVSDLALVVARQTRTIERLVDAAKTPAAAAGVTLGPTTQIKLQHFADPAATATTTGGWSSRTWDDLRLLVPNSIPQEDWYAVTLEAGQAATLAASADFTSAPNTLFGLPSGPVYTGAQIARIARTLQAELLASFPRTAEENAQVNWGQVVTYASAGRGSGQHIAMAVTAKLAGVKLTHVPYRGAQAAYQDVLGGRVDLFFDISSTARSQVDSGTVRALAVSSRQRQPMHPDVPSVMEAGVAALDMESWFGLFAPAATPAPVLGRLRAEFAKVVAMPDVAALFANTGGRVMNLSLAETEALVKRDIERWTKLIRDAGLMVEE